MKKKLFHILFILTAAFWPFLPRFVYAHNPGKQSGRVDVNELLQPDDDLSTWEHVLLYSVNGLLLLFSIILISMLIRRKKPGKFLLLFLFLLAADYFIVLHYGSVLDLLG